MYTHQGTHMHTYTHAYAQVEKVVSHTDEEGVGRTFNFRCGVCVCVCPNVCMCVPTCKGSQKLYSLFCTELRMFAQTQTHTHVHALSQVHDTHITSHASAPAHIHTQVERLHRGG